MRNRKRIAHAVEDATAAEEVPAAADEPMAADAGVALAAADEPAAEEPAAEEPAALATVARVDDALPPPLVEEAATVEELLVAQYCSRADSTPALFL
jgi:hypothetical protein